MGNILLDTNMTKVIIDFITSLFSGIIAKDALGLETIWTTAATGIVDQMSNEKALSTIIDGFVPVGYMMAMIYLSKEFLEKTTLKTIDLEQIFKMFLKLVIACALIMNVKSLIIGMNTFSSTLTTELQKQFATISYDNLWTTVKSQMGLSGSSLDSVKVDTGVSGWDVVSYIIYTCFGGIGLLVAFIAILSCGFSRAIQIGYKAIYAPIAVANIVGYSTRNAAIAYLKDFFATCMQLPIAYLGYALAITASDTLSKTNHQILSTVVFFLAVRWVTKSKKISTDLFT